MRSPDPFATRALGAMFETLLPDFVLALAFFTALVYAVLSKRFGRQRPAIAMSVALALALSTGLVWWERSHGTSIRDLGPLAIALAVLLLCTAVFRALRQIGGVWAGVAIGFGVSLVAAWMLGLGAAVAPQVVWAIILIALAVGIVALLVHFHHQAPTTPMLPVSGRGLRPFRTEMASVRGDLDDLRKDRRAGKSIWQRLRNLRKDSEFLAEHPGDTKDIVEQLRRMLPTEGWLTERLARLRARAHRVREGHVTRIDELRHVIGRLSGEARKRAAQELTERYHELKLDIRLERLDKAVAESECRIRNLTREAEQAAGAYDYRRLTGLLESAESLQGHNCRLFKTIDRTEEKLARIIRRLAEETVRWQRETASAQVEVTDSRPGGSSGSTAGGVPGIRVAVAATRQDRRVADGLLRRLALIRRATRLLPEHSQQTPAIMAQLRKVLPAEGWLTEQVSQLRATAHHLRDGHLAHLKEAKAWYDKLPKSAQKKTTADLARRYRQLANVDKRLERLDGAVAETERRIVRLTREAEQALSQGKHRALADLLNAAERLQKHNSKLLKTIERTNEKLLKLAEYVAPVAAEGGSV